MRSIQFNSVARILRACKSLNVLSLNTILYDFCTEIPINGLTRTFIEYTNDVTMWR